MTRYTPQWIQAGSYSGAADRRLIGALWPQPASSGMAVSASSAMTVNVYPGQAAVPSSNNTGSTLCTSDANEQVTLTQAPASGTNRYDLVIIRPRATDIDGGTNNDFIFDYVTGTAAATPTVPATPAGTVALAQVYIPGGSAAITAGNITDVRPWGLAVASALSLPPPVTSGALQSYTDANGEVWVAKPGANGGAWKKARDVLHARVWRSTNLSVTGSQTPVAYDTVTRDPYGMFGSGGLIAPIPGLYLASNAGGGALTPGMTLQLQLAKNGALTTGATAGVPSGGTSNVYNYPHNVDNMYLNAGDVITTLAYLLSGTSVAFVNNTTVNYLTLDYLGTG